MRRSKGLAWGLAVLVLSTLLLTGSLTTSAQTEPVQCYESRVFEDKTAAVRVVVVTRVAPLSLIMLGGALTGTYEPMGWVFSLTLEGLDSQGVNLSAREVLTVSDEQARAYKIARLARPRIEDPAEPASSWHYWNMLPLTETVLKGTSPRRFRIPPPPVELKVPAGFLTPVITLRRQPGEAGLSASIAASRTGFTPCARKD